MDIQVKLFALEHNQILIKLLKCRLHIPEFDEFHCIYALVQGCE